MSEPEEQPVRPSRVIRKFASFEEQDLETRRYWAGRTIAEKMQATPELMRDGYRARGIDVDAPGWPRTIVKVQRGERKG